MSNMEYFIYGKRISIKDPLPEKMDIKNVISKIEQILPRQFFNNIDILYIGQFKVLLDRQVNALYDSGTIYISNIQDSEKDIIDDIVHEISHSIEEVYGMEIYGDGKIESEFIVKRSTIERILKHNGYFWNYCF